MSGLHRALGMALLWQQRQAEAEVPFRRAEASLRRTLGADHPGMVPARNTLAGVLFSLGKHEEAQALYLEAIAFERSRLAAADPGLAELVRLLDEERYEEAAAANREPRGPYSLPIRTQVRQLINLRANLATSYQHDGQFAHAETQLRRVRELDPHAHEGAEYLAHVGRRLAGTLLRQGRYADALQELQAVQALLRDLEDSDLQLAETRIDVGDVLMARGEHAEAAAEYRAALTSLQAADASPLQLSIAERGLATALWSAGRRSDAGRFAESSWARVEGLEEPMEPEERQARAAASFAVARSRPAADDPELRHSAAQLARDALAFFSSRNEFSSEAAEVRAWLAEHAAP